MILKSSKGASLGKEKQIPCFPSIFFISPANKCKSLRKETFLYSLRLWVKMIFLCTFISFPVIWFPVASVGPPRVCVQGYKFFKFDLLGS